MKALTFLLSLLFSINLFCSQFVLTDSVFVTQTTKENRELFKIELRDSIIFNTLSLPITPQNIPKYEKAFWAAELGLFRDSVIKSVIVSILRTYLLKSYDDSFYRRTVQAAYTLFPRILDPEIFQILNLTDNPKLFAMCMSYLMQYSEDVEFHRSFYKSMLGNRFPDWANNPILQMLNFRIENKTSEVFKKRPSLIDLFSYNYGNDKVVIFSIQRHKRNYPGLALIRTPDGKFVRIAEDSIFSVPQLARSITNMPGYITNGNTPQGILSIRGIDTSKNVFIGPTPNLQLILPFEDSASVFFHKNEFIKNDSVLYLYKHLLPESWRNYFPIYEAYYAGKAGRTEIISHGTTIDPSYYLNEPYYPNTPSLGCLCCFEKWDETGYRIESSQQKLIDAYLSTGYKNGYVIVIDIDNKPKPVSIEELQPFIREAEKR